MLLWGVLSDPEMRRNIGATPRSSNHARKSRRQSRAGRRHHPLAAERHHRPRSDARTRGAHGRAPFRRLGRECYPDRAADRRSGRRHRTPAWLRFPEPAPQQARHHPEPEDAGRPRRVHEAGSDRRRDSGKHARRREASPESVVRRCEGGKSAHRLRLDLRLRPRWPVRPAGRCRSDRPGHGRLDDHHRRTG